MLAWIKARHYLRSTPPGFAVVLEFLENGERVGAMQLGRPTSRSLNPDKILELNRMYFVDEMPKNTESAGLAMMRRWVHVWMPRVKLILAYSDPSAGHQGIVYQADNWANFGKTKRDRTGWATRPGRMQRKTIEPKLRWVRTP
jgi:hypothetical protein